MFCFFPSFFNPNPCCDIRTQKRLSGTPGLKDPVLKNTSKYTLYIQLYYIYTLYILRSIIKNYCEVYNDIKNRFVYYIYLWYIVSQERCNRSKTVRH
jgi:hypothetical protein